MLSELFTSKTRAEVLRILFDGNAGERYLRELEKLCDLKVNSIQKEIKHLKTIELIEERKSGNRIYYKANISHPIYPELVSIVEKTVGVISLLKEKLEDPRVKCAFVFGSVAQNKQNAASDLDIVVIGSLGMRALTKLLSGLQEKISREINPHIFTQEEFKNRIDNNDHFVKSILSGKTKPLIGSVDDYR